MPDEKIPREEELASRQGDLYAVGKALRRTFDAENHESLGTDLTGLMLELARIDPDAPAPGRGALPPVAPGALTPSVVSPASLPTPRSWWGRLIDRLLD